MAFLPGEVARVSLPVEVLQAVVNTLAELPWRHVHELLDAIDKNQLPVLQAEEVPLVDRMREELSADPC